MLLKILLVSFVVLLFASIFDFDFNKWMPLIALILFAVYEVVFCWFHPLLGAGAFICMGFIYLMVSYEMDRPEDIAKHKGLFYVFVGVFTAIFILQIAETFAGRLF